MGGQLANLLSTEEVYKGKRDAKVERAESDIYAECVPAVRFYEVF